VENPVKRRRTLFHYREIDVRKWTHKRVFAVCRPSGKMVCRTSTAGAAEEVCAALNARLKQRRAA
jgi:hypothetical protein